MTRANREVVIAAPFIRAAALQRLLAAIGDQVQITCVTRWLPGDFVAGVADLSPWYSLQERAAPCRLFTRNDLHAKYYRADSGCLVGSANVTGAALGWSDHPNLEILIPISADEADLVEFESGLLKDAIEVNAEYIARLEEDLKTLLLVDVGHEEFGLELSEEVHELRQPWMPASRHPENLWAEYSGDRDSLTSQAETDARADLSHISVPRGLDNDAFIAGVRIAIRSEPVVRLVDREAQVPRRFGEMRQTLSRMRHGDDVDAATRWQTLMRWLLYFYPERYQVQVPGEYSEVFSLIPGNRAESV